MAGEGQLGKLFDLVTMPATQDYPPTSPWCESREGRGTDEDRVNDGGACNSDSGKSRNLGAGAEEWVNWRA